MKRVIKNNYKFILGLILGLVISVTTVYAIDAYIESNKVTYNNHNKSNVEEAIDELYENSGIHKDKWVDPILNGADPVFDKEGKLIPVEIKPNGDVYYASENSEWYNYSEKRWANAVILIDKPSNTNYEVGDKIEEDDIESYFVWIPRYQYKIWTLANTEEFTKLIYTTDIVNNKESTESNNFWKLASSNSRIIDVVFGDVKNAPKMAESAAAIDKYYTHPAFTLGSKNLNGIWVSKFEVGYKGATSEASAQVDQKESKSVIIKPDVYSWRGINVKNMFLVSYNYERDLDSHMLKNTEWGAVAYLSQSVYGKSEELNINNASDYKTGYGATAGTDQTSSSSVNALSTDSSITSPYNSLSGYLASTTGNITGVYDMSGGAYEQVAAFIDGTPGESGFTIDELNKYISENYIDKYNKNSTATSFNYRILGDATGELGPFYRYHDVSVNNNFHNSWYSDTSIFIETGSPCFGRGGSPSNGVIGGILAFRRRAGVKGSNYGFRLALSIN